MTVAEIDPTDPAVLADPFTAYGKAREEGRLARMRLPGLGTLWIATRHEDAREVLGGGKFELTGESFMRPPGIPEHCHRYLRTMAEMEGAEHLRLRTLAAPAFTASRARAFRSSIERIVTDLLDALPGAASPEGEVDLLEHFARPLPMDVICELVGIPVEDRPQWREYGVAVVGGFGPAFVDAVPRIVEGAQAAVARRKEDPADDLISTLLQVRAEDGDRLTDDELVTLVWHLVLAGQTPANLIGNAVEVLLTHPEHLAALRADPSLMPRAVEELTRLAGPQLLTTPRFAKEDVTFDDVTVRKGERVSVAIVSANRDPRAYTDPDTLDLTRTGPNHLGYAHGPHFCLGAAFARTETEIALTALITRYPDLALAGQPERTPDGGTWRLATLPVVTLGHGRSGRN
ncbi:cytochrome P450 family protein [Saccharothrix variisporea]|uniref:Cytochrome P450 n=1 Tax=Saccharothrix variisporea TaxID=543527 RepID=A0A495X4F6_9PSEU|nr:cytochrome P450 [Saccharothrix variisporea]RKT68399.1 cytochrome P450 [Saccharothrix variisporea]